MLVPKKVVKSEEETVSVNSSVVVKKEELVLLDSEKRPCNWEITFVNNKFILVSEVTGRRLELDSLDSFNKALGA